MFKKPIILAKASNKTIFVFFLLLLTSSFIYLQKIYSSLSTLKFHTKTRPRQNCGLSLFFQSFQYLLVKTPECFILYSIWLHFSCQVHTISIQISFLARASFFIVNYFYFVLVNAIYKSNENHFRKLETSTFCRLGKDAA